MGLDYQKSDYIISENKDEYNSLLYSSIASYRNAIGLETGITYRFATQKDRKYQAELFALGAGKEWQFQLSPEFSTHWFKNTYLSSNALLHNFFSSESDTIAIKKQNGNTVGLNFSGLITKRKIGFSTGIYYTKSQSELNVGGYRYEIDTNDIDDVAYQRRIIIKDLTENQTISTFSIPIGLVFNTSVKRNMGFYFEGGVKLYYTTILSYKGSGIFSYQGIYENFEHDPRTNIPSYGFYDAAPANAEGVIDVKASYYGIYGKLGFVVPFGNKLSLLVFGGYEDLSNGFSVSLKNNISNISTQKDEYNSITAISNKISYDSYCIGARLIWTFRK